MRVTYTMRLTRDIADSQTLVMALVKTWYSVGLKGTDERTTHTVRVQLLDQTVDEVVPTMFRRLADELEASPFR
uniref:Uncharacterized protein n=1 Tax=uncultured prokaryote TaxID=198431 RepID=A0A0H5QNK5_9ZZZZ|nr:hypothetical protein [uncultured prokaryote]